MRGSLEDLSSFGRVEIRYMFGGRQEPINSERAVDALLTTLGNLSFAEGRKRAIKMLTRMLVRLIAFEERKVDNTKEHPVSERGERIRARLMSELNDEFRAQWNQHKFER